MLENLVKNNDGPNADRQSDRIGPTFQGIAELEREERTRDRQERLRRLREATADIRRQLRHPLAGSNHDWLYDENGLPR